MLPGNHPARNDAKKLRELAIARLSVESRLPIFLAQPHLATATELLVLAKHCRRYHERYPDAVELYRAAFKIQPSLADDAEAQHRYYGARVAALAGCGYGIVSAKLTDAERAPLRNTALTWLREELEQCRVQLIQGKPEEVVRVGDRLSRWRLESELRGVRDAAKLAELPDGERQSWEKWWRDVSAFEQHVRAAFLETQANGALSAQEPRKTYNLRWSAGVTYVIDLESSHFDAFLRLEDADGKKIADNDDIAEDNLDARLIFTPPSDGVYRLVASSYEDRGVGAFTLRIREVRAK